ncbi:unnamed protein product [Lathyrus sativus]|nr:unnamed protein product [Lathyrus sativus]
MMNHDDDDVSSWLTLSLPCSSSLGPFNTTYHGVPHAAALSYKEQDMVNSSSCLTLSLSPPQPQQLEYAPLTPSLSPPNAITGSNSVVLESPQTIQPPFPWATLKPATVHTINHLLYDLNINTISGTLECKFCKFQQTDVRFDLLEKFEKVANFIEEKKSEMFERAPDAWMKPVLPNCRNCGPKSKMRPLIGKNEEINWLFLFLGEMIGCCNLVHLKYFCQHANIHRSGAKDRLLYQTYLSLYKQLQPH